MRQLFLLLFLALPVFLFSQTITLSGKITDPDNHFLEAATVYIKAAKDSTLIDYTITSKNGIWQIKTKPLTAPVLLKVSFVGFKGYSQKLEAITKDTDFGTIKLEDNTTELGEVIVEGEVPPIRMKKDTLEFNAASFTVKPDANLQDLLKQLPGIEIDADGKMTINGKDIGQILINGKPFFDKDGKVALQNLPAEIINKIQVTALKTKEEELSGQKASSNNASINITIDEEKNKGMFGRATVGFGSSGRFERSLLANYFKGERKISILGSTNNINAVGFSMDEIFDNMSGGRNNSVWSNGSSFNINGMQFGGDTGITRSNILGLNYTDKWSKGFDGGGSYFFTDATTDNTNKSSVTNFVTKASEDAEDLSYTSKGSNVSRTYRYSNNYSGQFNIAPDSTISIYIEPKFVRGYNRNDTESLQSMSRVVSGRLLTDTQGLYGTETENNLFSNMIVATKSSVKKKGRGISFNLRNENSKSDDNVLNNSTTNTYSYDNAGNQDVSVLNRNVLRKTRTSKDEYITEMKLYEPLKDSVLIGFNMVYSHARTSENRQGYDFDAVSGGYSSYNDVMSGFLHTNESRISPRLSLSKETSKVWANVTGGVRYIDFKAEGVYTGAVNIVSRNYLKPYATAQVNYEIAKSKSIWASYEYTVNMQQASQVLNVPDVFNQLSSRTGYNALKPADLHEFYINFNNYDYSTRTGFSAYAGGNYFSTAIVSYSEVDENAIIQNSYRNVSGTYSSWFGGYWAKGFKKNAHEFKLNLGLYGSFDQDKGYLNGTMFEGKSKGINPYVNFTYKYGDLVTINPFYRFENRFTDYKNYAVSSAKTQFHRLGINTTSYWPKHITFGNDFTYFYNPQQASFRKDYYLWNASIGYSFWKDKLTFKTKVYDLLNQNQGVTRIISATSVSEQQNTVLKRYIMFSLSIKLDKFSGKKADNTGSVISF